MCLEVDELRQHHRAHGPFHEADVQRISRSIFGGEGMVAQCADELREGPHEREHLIAECLLEVFFDPGLQRRNGM